MDSAAVGGGEDRFKRVQRQNDNDARRSRYGGKKASGWGGCKYALGKCWLDWFVAKEAKNLHKISRQTLLPDPDWPGGKAAVDFYFMEPGAENFKVTLPYEPYFKIGCHVCKASWIFI